LLDRASTFALPRLRPWRTLAALPPALAFLAVRALAATANAGGGSNAVLADHIAADLTARWRS
jgi:hypothetical protein